MLKQLKVKKAPKRLKREIFAQNPAITRLITEVSLPVVKQALSDFYSTPSSSSRANCGPAVPELLQREGGEKEETEEDIQREARVHTPDLSAEEQQALLSEFLDTTDGHQESVA